MNQLLPYIIKSTSILFILLVYYKLFLRKQTFFRLNRLYLLSALLIAIITPFISIELRALTITPDTFHPVRLYMSNLLDEVYVLGNYTTEEIVAYPAQINWFALVYWVGVTFFSFRYIFAFIQILQLKHRHPHKHFHGLTVIVLPTRQPAFSFFNHIFVSSALSVEDRHKIFEHEKIHIRQLHCLDLLIAEIICIGNWFNPLVWIFKNTIIENHEYIADRQVVRRFHTGSYLELLLRQTFRGAFSFTNYLSCSNLKKRTIMMTKQKSRKYWVLSFIPVTALLVTLLYGFTCNKSALSSSPILVPEVPEVMANVQPISTSPQIADDSIIFTIVETMPEFSGGNINRWISQNVKYPAEAVQNKIEGKVYVQFIIEKDGQVNGVKVLRGVDPLLDQEAIRVIQSMPKWKPGTQRGIPVRVSYTLPIYFALPDDQSPAPGQRYEAYLVNIDKIIKKIQDPSLLTEQDKAPIGKMLLGDVTDNKLAYEKQLEWVNSAATPSLINIRHLMDSLNFSTEEQNIVNQTYNKQIRDMNKLIQSIGPDNFIQKFSAIPSFEYSRLMLEAQIALKNDLSPERYKQFILGTYLKSHPQQDIFVVVEEMPVFPGGTAQDWIARNMKYPDSAVRNKTEGKVYVNFVIEKDGSISNIKVVRGADPILNEEAIRLMNTMPDWKPGKQRGLAVRVSYSLAINFRLNK